jgi:hypothetical protein
MHRSCRPIVRGALQGCGQLPYRDGEVGLEPVVRDREIGASGSWLIATIVREFPRRLCAGSDRAADAAGDPQLWGRDLARLAERASFDAWPAR